MWLPHVKYKAILLNLYCICLKKCLGVYYRTGPLGLALKQDGRLFKVGICSLKLSESFYTSLPIL